MGSWNEQAFSAAVGRDVRSAQDNHTCSSRGVLCGLRYQLEQTQDKLVRITYGPVFDVVVDLLKSSSTFGQHVSVELGESTSVLYA